ncbi:MAG: hypothetical protein ACOYT8_02560 [Candidatus Dependentiae bacterium]
MSKIRCLLKYCGKYYLICFIRFVKDKVLVSFTSSHWSEIFGLEIEHHFNYPSNGKLHSTYNHFDKTNDSDNFFIHAYSNKIVTKSFKNGQQKKDERNGKELLNHFINNNCRPLSEYETTSTFFDFPCIGFAICSIPEEQFKKFQASFPKENDVIIDAELWNGTCVTITPYVANKEYELSFFPFAIKSEIDCGKLKIGIRVSLNKQNV